MKFAIITNEGEIQEWILGFRTSAIIMWRSRNSKKMKPLNILGLTIFSLGFAILVGFGLYQFFKDIEVSQIVKWGIIAIIFGVIILLISLIKERLKEPKL